MTTTTPRQARPDAVPALRTTLSRAWPALLLSVVAALVVGTHVASYDAFSPIDEFQHYDYVVKVTSGELVQTGERVGPEAMAEESCRGVDAPGVVLPACGETATQQPSAYQEQGFNTASGHSPAYYLVTGAVARVLDAATPLGLFSASRLVGAAWLAGGLLLLLAAGRQAGAPTVPLVGAALWATGAPGLLHSMSTVNPDSTALFAGSLVLLAGLRWDAGRWPLWALCLASATATTLKVTNVLVVLAVAVLLLLRTPGTHATLGPWVASAVRTRLLPLVAVGASALAPQVFWSVVTASSAVTDPTTIPMTQRFAVSALGLSEVLGNVGSAVVPITGYVPGFLMLSAFVGLAALTLGWLLVAGMVGGSLVVQADRLGTDLARSTLLLALLGGPLVVLLTYVSASVYFPIPPRYGLSLLPAMLVAVACLARDVRVGRALLGLGALAPLAVLTAAF